MRRPVEVTSCADVDARLEAWLDGELADAEAAAVEAHLEQCRHCAAEAEVARAVRFELRALPSLDAPPFVVDAVQRQTLVPRRWLAVAVAAVAATVLLSVGLGVHQSRRAEPQSNEVARATAEAKYALALIARATRQASSGVKREVLDRPVLSPAIQELLGVLPRGDAADLPAEVPSSAAKTGNGA
jgi:anti-sigma factor RsiW